MVFIGKGPDQELLEKQALQLGISDRCIFTGPIYDRDKLRAWNTRADLFLFPSTFDTNGLVVREAAACGLASVLIRDSCAAEGITDGHNGFLIDETPEALAALLGKVCGDLSRLYEVGQNAMDEIYLSWEDCVSAAFERYEWVLEQKKAGLLPKRKKDTSDLLVSMTAQRMGEQEKLRRIGKELFHDFRETAIGMMDNIQEAEETAERLFELSPEEFAKEFYNIFKR